MDVFGLHLGASKGTFGDAKCVTEILGGQIRMCGGQNAQKLTYTSIFNFKIFPGVIPGVPDPVKKEGWGKRGGRGMGKDKGEVASWLSWGWMPPLALTIRCNDVVTAVQTPGGTQTKLNLRPVTELRIL